MNSKLLGFCFFFSVLEITTSQRVDAIYAKDDPSQESKAQATYRWSPWKHKTQPDC